MSTRDIVAIVAVVLLFLLNTLSAIQWMRAEQRAERAESDAERYIFSGQVLMNYMRRKDCPSPFEDKETLRKAIAETKRDFDELEETA